jgi:hypothetical protein
MPRKSKKTDPTENDGGELRHFLRTQTNAITSHYPYNPDQKIIDTSHWRTRPPILNSGAPVNFQMNDRSAIAIPNTTTTTTTTTTGIGIHPSIKPITKVGEVYYDQSRFIRPDHPAARVKPNATFTFPQTGVWQ